MTNPLMPSVENYVLEGLRKRGFNDAQAYALLGNIKQESGFNPGAINPKEQAYGLLQFRDSRREALNDFARAQGSVPNDIDTQLDFIKNEMTGVEAKNAAEFLGATNIADANAGLKSYIRYGDASEGTRLKNAEAFAGIAGMQGKGQSGGLGLSANALGANQGPEAVDFPANPLTPSGSAAPSGVDKLQTLALLQSMFPKASFTPLNYDPWKYVPQGGNNDA